MPVSPARTTGARRSALTSGWWPAGLVAALSAVLLHRTGVPVRDVLAFATYLALALALPGTLLWRLLVARGRRPLYADVACGTALAYCVETLVYLAARAVGVPLLVLAWPALALAVSCLPRFRRRCWRPRGVRRQTPVVSWGLAGVVAFATTWTWWFTWPLLPTDPVALRRPYVDVPFQLALVGELRHHVPPQLPMVAGEPLRYQWFTHAEVAATSWVTGTEPILLLLRLAPHAMLVTGLLVACALAARLARRPWAGVLAGALLVVLGPIGDPWPLNAQYLGVVQYQSTTQSLGLATSAAVLAVLVEVVGPRRVRAGTWAALLVTVVVTAGAKGTFVPLVVAGLVGTVVLATVWRRDRVLRIAGALVLAVVALLVVQRLVYGGSAQAVEVRPLVTGIDLARAYGVGTGGAAVVVVSVFYVVTKVFFAAGAWGLVRRRAWRDPRAVLLVGFALAGIGCTFVLWHVAQSQVYFLRSTPVALAVVSAWGLSRLVPRRPRRIVVPVVAVAALGAVGGWLLTAARADWTYGVRSFAAYVVAVLALVVVIAAPVAVGLARRGRGRHVSLVVTCAALGVAASSLPVMVDQVAGSPRPTPVARRSVAPPIATGGIDAARWVRDHAAPDDVVATNTHCRRAGVARPGCDTRRFWMSGYAERRFLLEGWAYDTRIIEQAAARRERPCCLPFWDETRRRTNDAAFTRPSASTLDALRARGVRWLIVDAGAPDVDLTTLRRLLPVRRDGRDYVVLELTDRTRGDR